MISGRRPPPEDSEREPGASRRPSRRVWEISSTWLIPSVNEIEERFEDLLRRRWGRPEGAPPADVFVVGKEIWVEVDLPGVEEREVDVRLEGRVLLVEATRRIPPPSREARVAWTERPGGTVRRQVPLPAPVPSGRLELRLEGGVLRIRIHPEEEK